MKTVELQIPDGYKLEQTSEGKLEIVKEEVTLEQILKVTQTATVSTPFDDRIIRFGNIDQLNRVDAMFKLLCVAEFLNDGWKPSWSILTKENKWCIKYTKNTGEFYVECWRNTTYGQVIFKTKELALKAIDICGEELLKVAFGVQK